MVGRGGGWREFCCPPPLDHPSSQSISSALPWPTNMYRILRSRLQAPAPSTPRLSHILPIYAAPTNILPDFVLRIPYTKILLAALRVVERPKGLISGFKASTEKSFSGSHKFCYAQGPKQKNTPTRHIRTSPKREVAGNRGDPVKAYEASQQVNALGRIPRAL